MESEANRTTMAEHEQSERAADIQEVDANETEVGPSENAGDSNATCGNFQTYMVSWIIIVAYVLIGGAFFMLVESGDWTWSGDDDADALAGNDTDDAQKPDINMMRLELLHSLRDIWTGDPDNWTDVAVDYLKNYDREVNQMEMALQADHDSEETRRQFGDWFNACFFCLTVISAIGYGHLIPVTTGGYALLLVYTVIGIPLFFIFIFKLGELLAVPIKMGYLRLCSCAARQTSALFGRKAGKSNRSFRELTSGDGDDKAERRGRRSDQDDAILADDFDEGGPEPDHDHVKVDFESSNTQVELSLESVEIPLIILFLVVLTFVIISSAIFAAMEGWPFLASFYFSVITITTVGFGDYLPDTDSNSKHFFISFYIVTGLLLLSICIHLMLSRIARFSDWIFNLRCCTRARCLTCCST